MDLFEYSAEKNKKNDSPLAMRMRPRNLEEVIGQEHILGKDKLLSRMIRADKLSSIIFFGPPGTGKTTLARVIANTTKGDFVSINANTSGKKDMEKIVESAKENIGMYSRKTILFIDEIHRFNKSQQDFLLPFVEDGTVILIGATTENPYFEVNRALLSRSVIFELKLLTKANIKEIILNTLKDKERGLGNLSIKLDEDALDFLADMSSGDGRRAINALELAALTTTPDEEGIIHITTSVASESIQRRVLSYDKDGDNHYDVISAFIKSMRGSDPDAAVFYLAKMLKAGEDIKFISRRIMICASEDVGNADPQALQVAVSAALAIERVGMPEASIILSHAATYVALAPKSNSSYLAIDKAMGMVDKLDTTVPSYLRDAHYDGHEKLDRGVGYKYAHNYPHHYVKQQYLPDEIKDETFYNLGAEGYENEIKKHLNEIGAHKGNEDKN
ncbi:MAG: replication-associated recombination protein A [Lachnospiraceae bacterium]|jgi:putative ATPase|nr:replication-associated recombination protein A [Lachnospiraceae bacterium]